MQKLTANDPATKSPDLVDENVSRLRALFPELVTEGPDGVAVNLDVLKQLVGDRTVTDAEEKYGLSWHGKRRARQLALSPSTGTLRPCPEDSVDWDTTQNLMIEGDNLEVLKLLQKSYAGKVKLIYIDPPYNTGKDFVYPDNFQDHIKNYLELTGQTGEGSQRLSSNTEASGRFHTDWLNMMYPRLKLARSLLREDGTILISIDDHEVSNLRAAMDEVFGPESFYAAIAWQRKDTPAADAKGFSVTHEYVLVYTRSAHFQRQLLARSSEQEAIYKNPDNDPRGPWTRGAMTRKEYVERDYYPIKNPQGRDCLPPSGTSWRLSRNTYANLSSDGRIWWGKDNDGNMPFVKRFLSEVQPGVVPVTWWNYKFAGSNRNATMDLRALFPTGMPFESAKPVKLIGRFLETTTEGEGIVLDFFAGSGTTGHAVMVQNATDRGRRRYILVQLPEPTRIQNSGGLWEETAAWKAGYPTIAEITKERLRRAGKKIHDENPLFAGDFGFRVFKLDSSNIQTWDPDRADLAASLEAHTKNLKEDRTEQDILFELLLKLGLDLTVPIVQRTIAGKAIHSIGGGVLLVCLAESITQAEAEPVALGMVAWHKEQAPVGESTVVFRDSAFADDVAKTNLAAILHQQGLETVRSL